MVLSRSAIGYGRFIFHKNEWRAIRSPAISHLRQRVRYARCLHNSLPLLAVKPFILADIGEGIRECEVIQWFVDPGARVEQFDKLCEVQSDKASVEITSRFDGVIKKLHYEAGEMAIVGKPLVDIDILTDISAEDKPLTEPTDDSQDAPVTSGEPETLSSPAPDIGLSREPGPSDPIPSLSSSVQNPQSLATPAVRHLAKELNVSINDVTGSGPHGRVQKIDIERAAKASASTARPQKLQTEGPKPLTPIQLQMFKAMTKSLTIPQFLFSDSYSFSALSALKKTVNEYLSAQSSPSLEKVTYLPFLVKALSTVLLEFPLLNARLDLGSDGSKPQLVYRTEHNIGIAIDSPSGLIVPVIKSAQSLSLIEIGAEIKRLSNLARTSSLTSSDLSGGTITVSNIGNLGGTTTTPILVEGQMAIVGVGKVRTVPAFDKDGRGVIARQEAVLSWCADHRVVDGATLARAAGQVGKMIEEPGRLMSVMG